MKLPDLTVIIASIPERERLLHEAHRSLRAQTCWAYHITSIDTEHRGPAATLNMLAELADTTWLFRLDDDDLLDPDHFEVLSQWLTDDYDIVYTWCRVEGGGELHPANQFQVAWQADGWDKIHERNWVPSAAAVRKTLWDQLGGLRDVPEEDWDFWRRAVDAGARFACVPAVTWTYRMNREWAHRSDDVCESSSSNPAPPIPSRTSSEDGNERSGNSATRSSPTTWATGSRSSLLPKSVTAPSPAMSQWLSRSNRSATSATGTGRT